MLSKTHTKYIQNLSHKKFRDESGLFIAEGPKVVTELLTGGNFVCKEILAVQNWVNDNDKLLGSYKTATIQIIEDFELKKISALATSHQVLAVFKKRSQHVDITLAGKITLALDAIQDPGNLGTIIRIADWFGITDIICAAGTTDIYNPKVVQSTMGSLGRLNIVYTDLPVWLQKNKQVKIFSASLDGKDVRKTGKLTEGIIVIGNEANGVSEEVLKLVAEKITITKTGEAESLNAAVATGIILSHLT